MTHARPGFNREHVYEPSSNWDAFKVSSAVRHHPAHIIHIPIESHRRMNAELPQMAVISDRLGRMVLNWVSDKNLLHPEERWRLIEMEESYLRRVSRSNRGRILGREALYFADCLEIKLPFYKEKPTDEIEKITYKGGGQSF